MEPDEESHSDSQRLLWVVGCLLAAVGIAGGILYRYYPLRGHPRLLDKVPGLQKMFAANSKRTTYPPQVSLKTDADRRVEMLQGRINAIEKLRQSANAQLSALQAQLNRIPATNAPADAPPQGEAPPEQKTDPAKSEAQIFQMDQQTGQGQRDLEEAKSIEGRRVSFESGVHHERELVPGINLQVNETNVRKQRFDGWISLMPDRRTLTLHDRGLHQPLVFHTGEDYRPRQLVITRVTKYSVMGYLVLPRGSGSGAAVRSRLVPGAEKSKPQMPGSR